MLAVLGQLIGVEGHVHGISTLTGPRHPQHDLTPQTQSRKRQTQIRHQTTQLLKVGIVNALNTDAAPTATHARARVGVDQIQHSEQRGGTLAIDLGSTTTVVAYQGSTSATADLLNLPAICSRPGEVPSLVWNATQRPLIGRQVLESGLHESSDIRLHRDFKGRIGQADAPDQEAARWAGEQLLLQIWSRIPRELAIERLVLTAPVECYRAYRSWLLEACATLPVAEIALVDEPTAAAMGAGLPAGSTLLVVDWAEAPWIWPWWPWKEEKVVPHRSHNCCD